MSYPKPPIPSTDGRTAAQIKIEIHGVTEAITRLQQSERQGRRSTEVTSALTELRTQETDLWWAWRAAYANEGSKTTLI